jgi:hypothetical protein
VFEYLKFTGIRLDDQCQSIGVLAVSYFLATSYASHPL